MTLRIILLPLLLGYNLGMPIVANDPVVVPPLPIANDRVYEVSRISHTKDTEAVVAKDARTRTVTAYTSYPEQTWGDPCIGAWGDNLCELYAEHSICASNAYVKGTRLHVDGWGECTVLDRMNSRYPDRVDIYMGYDTPAAMQWGIRTVNVKEI